MARLPTFTLSFDQKKENWKLENDSSDRVVRRFETKEDATSRGVLKEAIGGDGGSVRIEKKRGGYEEERTFPRSRYPKKIAGITLARLKVISRFPSVLSAGPTKTILA